MYFKKDCYSFKIKQWIYGRSSSFSTELTGVGAKFSSSSFWSTCSSWLWESATSFRRVNKNFLKYPNRINWKEYRKIFHIGCYELILWHLRAFLRRFWRWWRFVATLFRRIELLLDQIAILDLRMTQRRLAEDSRQCGVLGAMRHNLLVIYYSVVANEKLQSRVACLVPVKTLLSLHLQAFISFYLL